MKKLQKENVVALLFISFGAFLRAWKLNELFHFTYDESVFAYIGRKMVVVGHIPLIGGVTPFHVHLGPYFYWFSAILLGLGKLSPIVWGYFAICLSIVTMVALYWAGKNIFGKMTAIFSLLFYAFSFQITLADRHYWGLIFNPLISILTLWSVVQITRGKTKYALLLGFVFAFGFHTDPSTWLFILTSFAALVWFRSLSWRVVLLSGSIFLLSFLPLVVFDIKHQGINILGFRQYFSETKQNQERSVGKTAAVIALIPQTLARTLYVFGDQDLAKQYAYCPFFKNQRLSAVPPWLPLLTLFILCFPLLFFRKQNRMAQIGTHIIYTYFLFTIIGIGIYGIFFGSDIHEHYLSTTYAYFALLFGMGSLWLYKKSPVIMVSLLCIFILSNTVSVLNATHSLGYTYKQQAVEWVRNNLGNKPFALESVGDCFKYSGYRYVFTASGVEPVKSYVDQNFFWLFDQLPAYMHPERTVVFVTDITQSPLLKKKYNHFQNGTYQSARFGAIEVLIVDNTNGQYNGEY